MIKVLTFCLIFIVYLCIMKTAQKIINENRFGSIPANVFGIPYKDVIKLIEIAQKDAIDSFVRRFGKHDMGDIDGRVEMYMDENDIKNFKKKFDE